MNCLSALCRRPAEYDVLMTGDWWWPECAEHTVSMREVLADYITAIETHDPKRPGQMALRDA
jgi:hypothetical protein